MQKVINYVNGQCGSGKTYTLPASLQYFKSDWNNDNKFIVTTSSIELGEKEIKPILESDGYEVVIINSKQENTHSVGERIASTVERTRNNTKIAIIITHQAYDTFPNAIFQDSFQLAQDEGSSIEREVIVETDSGHPFEDYFKVDSDNILSLTKKGREAHSFPNEQFRDVRSFILNDKRVTKAVGGTDDNFFVESTKNGKDIQRMTVFSMPTMEYYPDETIILTANKETCKYYQTYQEYLKIGEINMESRLKGGVIDLHYFTDKTRNSASFRKNNKKFMNEVIKWLRYNVGRSLIFHNKPERTGTEKSGWMHIPVNVHGMNSYTSYNSIMILGSLNNSGSVIKMKEEDYGITSDEQYRTGPCETFHQMIMRTSLRNPNIDEKVDVYLIDESTAIILKDKLESDYGFKVNLIFHDQFNDMAEVKRNDLNPISRKERNRINHLIKKAKDGKIKNKMVAMKIIAMSTQSKSNRDILKLDNEYKARGIKL